MLGDRSEQINRLLVNAKTLLAAFNERGRAIAALLQNISAFSAQVQGFINDNPNLNPVLEQLHALTDVLVARKDDLAQTLTYVSQFAASLGESVASGPYFKIVLSNLLPYWILQPFVDAAFKQRGIDPENFWRSAGLPEFRWPDPNGTRFPNGAPPPAPPVSEGTPDHPGPAVPPGTACSYTPAPDAPPRPWNPLPCAGVDVGPFGGGFPAPVDVQTSPPNPNGLPPTPGIPIAGRPGEPPPDVPGTPVPLPPNAPPGARAENRRRRSLTRCRDTRAAGTGAAAGHHGGGGHEQHLRFPQLRTRRVIGTLVVALALVAGFVGWRFYQKLTTNTVVAYVPSANALYPGDKVQIMGVRVGSVDKIEPAGDKMKVTFHYKNKYKVPANASAVIVNPTLVASRTIQLEPPYKGGPVMADNAVIPIERTQVPTEWDQLSESVANVISKLGPTPEQPKGPFGDVIESFADGLAGKGKQINTTLDSLSRALTALNEGRGDFFAVVHSLALFVNALHKDDQQFVALNTNLAQFTDKLTGSDRDLANAIQQFDSLLSTLRPFLDKNRQVLARDVDNLANLTTTLVQPEPLNGLETALHVLPTLETNLSQIYHPSHGAVMSIPAIPNFANPMQFLCSMIQAGSRLGYQESAELCAQYLAPILDAIKFNYLPVRAEPVQHRRDATQGSRLLRAPAAAAERVQGHHGSRDLGARHPVVAPQHPARLGHRAGHAGQQVGPITAGLLTPESLAELMGGPDIAPPQSGLQTPPGPPNAYDEYPVLPPIGVQAPQVPIPPPPPGPGVVPGPVAPTPAPAGPPLPAEAR